MAYTLRYKTCWGGLWETCTTAKTLKACIDNARLFGANWFTWQVQNSKGRVVAQKPQHGLYC